MTTYEHMMVGVTGTLATGVHRKYGWSIILMAGIVAISPDWDGLIILVSTQAFAEGHRVWGHNLFACLLGLFYALLDYRFDYSTRMIIQFFQTKPGHWFHSEIKKLSEFQKLEVQEEPQPDTLLLRSTWNGTGYFIWGAVGFFAVVSHLLADLVVSGTSQLADWKLKLFWPISDQGYVYPLVKWGDPGMSIIFVIGMLAAIKWPTRIQSIACVTLSSVVVYIVL